MATSCEQIWQAALGQLELSLSKANFTTWFKNTSIIQNKDGEVTIGVPNAFTKEWLENKYHKYIFSALQDVTKNKVKKIIYQVETKITPSPRFTAPPLETKIEKPTVADKDTDLNPKYTFDSFVVGPSNDLARAAALAVIQKPGKNYNPLFIFGGVGLGKTHLLQAIGNESKRKFPEKKIVYVTCERFTDDFINFIQKGKATSDFKNKYRATDVLLIDDIQFLATKERTQEEFFHTFNALYQKDKQIVLTSDRPPKAIAGLEDRLVSRFEGGMIADISMPDLETRKAILKEKCKEGGVELRDDILDYIASNMQSNIRELEGALSRLLAYCQLNGTGPTLEMAKEILANIVTSSRRKAISCKQVIETVIDFYDLDKKEFTTKNRKKEIAWPRQIAMYLMRDEAKASFPSIGLEVGGRDHTTAMHAYNKVLKELEQNDSLRQEIDLIRQRIYIRQNQR